MRHQPSLIVLALFLLIFAGCSKSSHRRTQVAPQITADLGTVELEMQTPKRFALGADKSLILTARPVAQGIEVDLVLWRTNADGSVKRSESVLTTATGQQGILSVGDEMIGLTPTLKQESAEDKTTAQLKRRLSEQQVAGIVTRELPNVQHFSCEFKNGIWEIIEVQPHVWGVSAQTTNAAGNITIQSTNATRVILRVKDIMERLSEPRHREVSVILTDHISPRCGRT